MLYSGSSNFAVDNSGYVHVDVRRCVFEFLWLSKAELDRIVYAVGLPGFTDTVPGVTYSCVM